MAAQRRAAVGDGEGRPGKTRQPCPCTSGPTFAASCARRARMPSRRPPRPRHSKSHPPAEAVQPPPHHALRRGSLTRTSSGRAPGDPDHALRRGVWLLRMPTVNPVRAASKSWTHSQESQASQDVGGSLQGLSWSWELHRPLPNARSGESLAGLGSLGSPGNSLVIPKPRLGKSLEGLGSLGTLGNSLRRGVWLFRVRGHTHRLGRGIVLHRPRSTGASLHLVRLASPLSASSSLPS
jgi:hypothetical protein